MNKVKNNNLSGQTLYKIVCSDQIRNKSPGFIYLKAIPIMRDGRGKPLPYMKVLKSEFKKMFQFRHVDNNDNVYILKAKYNKLLKRLERDVYYLFNLSLKNQIFDCLELSDLSKEIRRISNKYSVSEKSISALVLLLRKRFKEKVLS